MARPDQRITHAWCEELGDVITIDRARAEYFAQALPRAYFHFLCSSPECRAMEVPARITAVNYYIFAEDLPSHQPMHFRENPHTPHHELCEWVGDDQVESHVEPDERARQLARAKLHDFVEIFDPDVEPAVRPTGDAISQSGALPAVGEISSGSGGRVSRAGGRRRTSSLERLVEYYVQARAQLPKEVFDELTLRTPDMGTVRLRSYFAAMKYAKPGRNKRVMNGSVSFRRYGQGFALRFYDRVADLPVSIYVSPAQMAAHRHRRYLEAIVAEADKVRWFKAFARGSLLPDSRGAEHGFNFALESLDDLVLRLGPPKEHSAE
ncbi:hypothetical protein [Dyella sp.]|uniref:hypothetical protein n=1 Tax=Dyella sp. TaxID=1869338 RepID=UPI002ED515F5